MKKGKVEYKNAVPVPIGELIPYERNAKQHDERQVKNLMKSITDFGFTQPLVIDKDNVIVIGHGRYEAAKRLGLQEVPCIKREDLTDKEVKQLRILDNKLNESPWDSYLYGVELEAAELEGYDLDEEINEADWFENRQRDDDARQEGNDEYNEFLDKFEIPKTTDDCYTPDVVYDAVADYVAEKFGLNRKNFVRPFYPGGDYENEKYKAEDVVVDNPPFSILAQITRFYGERGIRYFLFAPGLTTFGGDDGKRCAICTNVTVIYENKANVSTSFVTNMLPEYVCVSDPELYRRVNKAAKEYAEGLHAELPKYSFPDEVVTCSKLGYFSKYGEELKIERKSAQKIGELDAMKESGKTIFGGGYLISEKAAAEKAAATRWPLSDREREIVQTLGKAT